MTKLSNKKPLKHRGALEVLDQGVVGDGRGRKNLKVLVRHVEMIPWPGFIGLKVSNKGFKKRKKELPFKLWVGDGNDKIAGVVPIDLFGFLIFDVVDIPFGHEGFQAVVEGEFAHAGSQKGC